MDKKTYKKELIRMWDSLRSGEDCKGLDNCYAVNCDYCVLNSLCHDFFRAQDAFDIIEAIEKWSKENPDNSPKY